jgi:uncharacterized protein
MKRLVLTIAMASSLASGLPAWAQQPPTFGQGPGYHDPRSPFKPLEERSDVVSWKLLSQVNVRAEKKKLIPSFPAEVQSLDKRIIKIQGFMMPLEPGDKQRHFLLSSVPTSCSFCVPSGPEGLVEVRTRHPVRYTLEPVVVEGQLSVLMDDPYGLYYRVVDGTAVP